MQPKSPVTVRHVGMRTILGLFMLAVFLTAQAVAPPPEPKPGLQRVGHIIIIFLENRSFDHLYGLFPGADGISNAGLASP
jgi:phospholipase C